DMATRGLGKGPKSAPKKKVVAAKPAAKKTAAKTASKKPAAAKKAPARKAAPAKKVAAKKPVAKAPAKKSVPAKKTAAVKSPAPKGAPAKKTAVKTISESKAMGRGLGALLSSDGIPENKRDSVVDLKINDISPNNGQPRKNFNDDALNELASSIEENGVIQPIIVQRKGEGYRIVAGERRWRAARIAGLSVIPAIVRDLSDKETMAQALIENIQREDLNPIEEASAMDNLLKTHKLTQEQLAKKLGKPRATIANTLRILNLDESLQEFVSRGDLSEGHAKAILALKDKEDQRKVADVIMAREMNVRQAEVFVKKYIEAQNNPSGKKAVELPDIQFTLSTKEVETKLKKQLGAKVKIKVLDNSTGRGRIVIDYKDNMDLDRLIEYLCN
ncbi:MAG: ParB/RepB/Spo0J family partition protein, partial [Clostridiales bacterium]|nr:ParB/RepB/Spo0J family partition protein [Clostridiales bacterium]